MQARSLAWLALYFQMSPNKLCPFADAKEAIMPDLRTSNDWIKANAVITYFDQQALLLLPGLYPDMPGSRMPLDIRHGLAHHPHNMLTIERRRCSQEL